MKMPPQDTPWGPYQKIQEVLPGVWLVTTAGHGGYWLTPERLAEMPAVLREGVQNDERPYDLKEVQAGWFEEDDEAARVVVYFARGADANAFPPGLAARVQERFQRDYPATWAALTAEGFFRTPKVPAPDFPVIQPGGTD